jgi:uncharacterized OsmC-like protein
MGITANRHQIVLNDTKVNITKIIAENPRRVQKIIVEVIFKKCLKLTDKEKILLENSARACPVAKSLHPEIIQEINFIYE